MSDRIYKAALLSNFTIKGLDVYFVSAAQAHGIKTVVYIGEYGQWQQEILGERLYDFNPNIVYVIVDWDDMDSQVEIIDQLAQKTSAKIIVFNQTADSELSTAQNKKLAERYKEDAQIVVFDFDQWLKKIGKNQYWNTKYRELGDMRLSPAAFEPLAKELAAYLIPLAGKTKKCLVLDLDNTLWGRIIGEEGVTGIALGPSGEGEPFYQFQKHIRTLKECGVILAINSSNNEADVKEVLANHEHMLLREDDFASIRANWNNKAQNMREIADELNIGLDSFVFIDDDPRNRELIKTALPEVMVIDLPADPIRYVDSLGSYKGFTSFSLTAEDKNKAQMYVDEKRRRQLRAAAIDLDSFLRGLDLVITIQPLAEEHVTRAAQLTQKTNQFNLTTRRYQEADIKQIISRGDRAWILGAKDKFGEYGLTGLIIARDFGHWEIDTFLLSCRILGKKIEHEFFGRVLDFLKKEKQQKVIGAYVPTQKNGQVKDFYCQFGFIKISSSESMDVWERDINTHEYQPLDIITTTII